MVKEFPVEIIDIILEEASVGITLVNQRGQVIWYNNLAKVLLGWSDEDKNLNNILKCHSQELNTRVLDKINNTNTTEWHSLIKLKGRFIENAYTPIRIKDRFTGIMIVTKDVTEREKMMEVLKKASLTDNLTGLYNRRFFDTVFGELLSGNNPFGIIIMDINGLKYVNDHFGHKAGDKLILQAVKNINQSVRTIDYVFRFGGDEFVVLVNEDRPEIIYSICSRIAAKNVKPLPDRMLGANLSIGACLSDEVADPKEVFACADERMYQDKKRFYQQEGSFIKQVF